VFTTAKTGARIALILLGIIVGLRSGAGAENFKDFWSLRGGLQDVCQGLTAATAFGLFVGICVAQTNSLFSADAWNNITFTAGEVKNPRRNVPLSLALGTGMVIGLYLLANVAYLVTLPLEGVPGKVAGVKAVDDQAAKDPNYLKDPQHAVAVKAAEEYRADPIAMGIQHAPG